MKEIDAVIIGLWSESAGWLDSGAAGGHVSGVAGRHDGGA